MAFEAFKFTAYGITDLADLLGAKLTNNGWVNMGVDGSNIRYYRSTVGDITVYVGIQPYIGSMWVRFYTFLYVDGTLTTSTPQAGAVGNVIPFASDPMAVNVVGIVDDTSMTIFCDKSNFSSVQMLSFGLCNRNLVLPEWGRFWVKSTNVVAGGGTRSFTLDRDPTGFIRTGQKMSIVQLKTGALLAENTVVNSWSATTINATIVNGYSAGAILGLLPVPTFCTEGVAWPAANVNVQFVLNSLASAANASSAFTRMYENIPTDIEPSFNFQALGANPLFISRVMCIDNNEGIMGVHPYLGFAPNPSGSNPVPLAPRTRIRTGQCNDPTDYWIAPWGNLFVGANHGVPYLGPGFPFLKNKDHQGLVFSKTTSLNVSIS